MSFATQTNLKSSNTATPGDTGTNYHTKLFSTKYRIGYR